MLVDDLSNIPPVNLNEYPSTQTNLIGGDSTSKSLPSDFAVSPYGPAGSSGPLSETCFPAYTNVLTVNGNKKISEISIGDDVLSFDDKNGNVLPKKVTHKFIHDGNQKSDIYRYTLSNGTLLDITKNHSVFTENGVFKQIGELNIGDKLVDVNDNLISIISCEFLKNDVVYNIEVEDFHTYFAENIKVHNALKERITFTSNGNDAFITGTEPGSIKVKEWTTNSTIVKSEGGATPLSPGVTDRKMITTFSFCFPDFSKVFTPSGKIKISELKIGDFIFTYNQDGVLEESKIVHKIEHIEDKQDVWGYTFSDGNELFVTDEHRVLTPDKEFFPINHVQIGEFVKNIFNEDVKLLNKRYIDNISVYSIFPEKNDTYIVDGIRVSSGKLVNIDEKLLGMNI
jgi:hypothetical protein